MVRSVPVRLSAIPGKSRIVLLGACVSLCGVACGGEESVGGDVTSLAPTAVVTAILVRGADTDHTYLVASEALPSQVDLRNAPELSGGSVWQTEDAIFVGENERLQRYVVKGDYTFELAGELSFINYGIDYLDNPPVFISPSRAYYVDAPRGQVIVFDPTSMVIIEDFPVPGLVRGDYYTWFGQPRRVGNRQMAAVLFADEAWTRTASDSTVGLVFDEGASEPIRFVQDERGAGAYLSWVADNGDFYFSADGLSGSLNISGLQDVGGPRVMRIRSGSDTVDREYMLDMGALLNTPGTFGFWPVSDTRFVVQAWASDVNPADVLEPGDSPWAAPYFDWFLVDAVTLETQPVGGLQRSVANNTIELRLDGRTYLERALEATSAGLHELYVLQEDGSAEKVAEAGGDFWFLGRVRTQP
jgi:hypothetical protein